MRYQLAGLDEDLNEVINMGLDGTMISHEQDLYVKGFHHYHLSLQHPLSPQIPCFIAVCQRQCHSDDSRYRMSKTGSWMGLAFETST